MSSQTAAPVTCPKCSRPGMLQELNSLRIIGKKYVARVRHAPTICLLTRTEFERLQSSLDDQDQEEAGMPADTKIKTRMLEAVRDSDIETLLCALASVCQDIASARQLEASQDSLPPLSAYRWRKLAETLKQIQTGVADLK